MSQNKLSRLRFGLLLAPSGLASARLLRHGILGDPEHAAEQVAGLASHI